MGSRQDRIELGTPVVGGVHVLLFTSTPPPEHEKKKTGLEIQLTCTKLKQISPA